jgi:uncharacterized protein YdhG (YjbR/CyaY superfamily)
MTDPKPAHNPRKKPAARKSAGKAVHGLTAEEQAAIREHVQELKAEGRGAAKADGESEVLAKIAAMQPPDRALGERLHAIIKANAPALSPKLWYGMPAYANEKGNVVCFFQDAHKFKTRYATLGFSDKAHLDDGHLWPTSFALTDLTGPEEAKIGALLKRALS